ncbi:uncharacterized protein I206_101118 [Kwoniella pini CBS 10737]|uniref:RING-type domain-containing protein n=1 Tax=Kwoniella pini CBS 10737 TaxID=1296096 RepID=A0A1B9IBX8_9TREE|nr:uncharacterized protein I206_00208 [Kwoniella pini CBS 10737]OCF52907.1 hypothetical protein I206_00208 [Kwoniella pini CBS 10737]
MPPPPLVFHSTSPPHRYLSQTESDFIPSYAPGTRRLVQPIPIEPSHPTTEFQPYSVGSQGSIMSDISNSLRPSPPPLTATSSLPTPFTLRTPVDTTSATATARPIINSPVSPSADRTRLNESNNGLVRVKSFPHAGDLLGSPNEIVGNRTSNLGELESSLHHEDMDVDENEENRLAVAEMTSAGQVSDERDAIIQSEPSAPLGSLTRLLRDIGNPAPSHLTSQVPAYIQPMLNDRASVFRSRWSQPVASPSASTEPVHQNHALAQNPENGVPERQSSTDFNELGPLHGDDSPHTQLSRYDSTPYVQPANYHPSTSGGYLPGEWGEAFTSHPQPSNVVTNIANRSFIPPNTQTTTHDPAWSSSTTTDFRTLPSPIANTASGSPSAMERRLDTIEARLARGRAQRSPPTPPGLIHGHTYEGLRSRGVATRPYDVASRSRPSSQTVEDGSRRSPFARSSIRPSWLDQTAASATSSASSSSSATVPPPRPRPTASFGWETSNTLPASRMRSFSGTDQHTQLFTRAIRDDNGRPPTVFPGEGLQRDTRSRYLQARLNMFDNLRADPYRRSSPTPIRASGADAWSSSATQFTDDSSTASDRSERWTNHNLPTWLGDTSASRSLSAHSNPLRDDDIFNVEVGTPFIADIPDPTWGPEPTRPGNRRWMSFDEGTENTRIRESSRSREETSSHVEAIHDLGLLNRDVNEVIGRRLSQPRSRPASISRRLRDHQGPDWEDTSVPDTISGLYGLTPVAPTAATRRDRFNHSDVQPARSRTGNPFGATEDDREPRDPLATVLGRDRSNTTSPADELAAFIDRSIRARPALAVGGEDAELLFLDRLRNFNNLNARHGDLMPSRNGYDGLEGILDISSDSPFAHLDSLRRYNNFYSTPSLGNMKITKDMDWSEKLKIVQLVIRGVSKLPTTPRKKAAESTLKYIKYGEFDNGDNLKVVEGLQKDEYCSVCHDDYEVESEITITPCRHMYHRGCLDTWLNNPSTSSCPMCRRDLAALAYLTKMVPTKEVDEASPLWMAVVV